MSPLSNRSAMASVMLFAATIATGLCFINNQSFWMDEGNAIVKAIMPTPAMMLDLAEHMRGSEIQMPLFMLALWAWEKIVGHAEYALRLINLPFLVVAVFALRRMPFWPLACLTSPFVLYYAGELRPYMLQIAGAATGLAALSHIAQDQKAGETKGLHTLLGSCIFLAASSLTAAVWSLGLVIGMLMMRPDWPMQKIFWRKAGIWLPLALAIAGYHTFMVVEGYRGAVARGGGLLSMGFGFYELAGMMGLGPERDAIRGFPLPRFLKEHPWLPAYAALFAVAWLAGVREWLGDKPIRIRIGMAAAAGTPVIMLAAVSMIADFSVGKFKVLRNNFAKRGRGFRLRVCFRGRSVYGIQGLSLAVC